MKIALLLLAWLALPVMAVPELTLANKYREGIDVSAYWISEKYDGVRAYWNGEQLMTRSGNKIVAPAAFLKQLPRQTLDGELWFGRQQFSRSAALVKRAPEHADYASEWSEVFYMVFDAPKHPGDFPTRISFLRKIITPKMPQIKVVDQWRVKDHGELQRHLKEISDQGAEGLMLRLKNAPYRPGRSDDLLKLKAWEDAEATVIAIIPGKGRLEGEMGSLLVRLDNGRELRIGSGFYAEERINPPAIGSRITFRFQGYTSSGLPRFAHYWRPHIAP